MQYRAIIFDLDGTLLNTIEDLALAANSVLLRHGCPEHPVEAYKYFVGDGIDLMVQRAFPAGYVRQEKSEQLVSEVKEEYGRRWVEHTTPYPGIPELLTFLEERQIPKAIFSNKPHEFALLTVETLLGRWRFVEVLGISPLMPRKPNPHGALIIASKLGLKPQEIVYLGDTATDMQTARQGGFFPAAALWGFRLPDELQDAGAEFLAGSPQDLQTLFI